MPLTNEDYVKYGIGIILVVALIAIAYYLYNNECYIADILKGDALARTMANQRRWTRETDKWVPKPVHYQPYTAYRR
jgi:hypothetical protein